MAKALSVLVLAGGISHERDISLRSGRLVADGLQLMGSRSTSQTLTQTIGTDGIHQARCGVAGAPRGKRRGWDPSDHSAR
jgi:D-alanine-D-alanine ligase and related ATP-grasp enzymes